jgi:hypothetical protein
MAKWLLVWTGSITAFVIFVVVIQLFLGGDRDSPISGDAGIKIAHTKNLPISGTHFFVDTTQSSTNIRFEAIVDVDNRQKNALIVLILPYSGIIQDNSGWKWRPFEDSTLFVKEFQCSSENPCMFTENNQFFDFELKELIDQKQSSNHSVRLWFFDSSPLLDPTISKLVRQYNTERKPFQVGFNELDNAKVTVILDKTSDSFGPTPYAPLVPGPQGNLQLDWDIQSGILHQIDYQIPHERNLDDQMIYATTMFGIALGVASLVVYSIEKRKMKLQLEAKTKNPVNKKRKKTIEKTIDSNTPNTNKKSSKK